MCKKEVTFLLKIVKLKLKAISCATPKTAVYYLTIFTNKNSVTTVLKKIQDCQSVCCV